MISENNKFQENQPKTTKLQDILSTVKELQNLTEVINAGPQENEFQSFAKHIVLQLEKLSPLNALTVRIKIQSLLTELRIQEVRTT